MISGPICLMHFQGTCISHSVFQKASHLKPSDTMTEHTCPPHSSNSKSTTLPSLLQSRKLITSLHFNSEKNILASLSLGVPYTICYISEKGTIPKDSPHSEEYKNLKKELIKEAYLSCRRTVTTSEHARP